MRPDTRSLRTAGRSAAVILAAGQASRMGAPKALLPVDGEPLVRRAVRTALDARFDLVSVVVAEHSPDVGAALAGLPVAIVINRRACDGIGTSIAAGVAALDADVDSATLTLCDQPLITSGYLAELRARATASPCQVVASRYANTVGVPALFVRRVFPLLMALSGDQGCKKVIQALAEQAAFLDCPEAAFDIDTPDDYATLAGVAL